MTQRRGGADRRRRRPQPGAPRLRAHRRRRRRLPGLRPVQGDPAGAPRRRWRAGSDRP